MSGNEIIEPIAQAHEVAFCKSGHGADTCRYLGWENARKFPVCLKGTPIQPMVDEKAETMIAKADGCEGWLKRRMGHPVYATLPPEIGKFYVNWYCRLPEKAQCAPNPAYPEGIDMDVTSPGQLSCLLHLPYPAFETLGYWVINCRVCGYRASITTAGRPDDPRSVRVPCAPMARA